MSQSQTRRPASADKTARHQFQAVFPVITGSFTTNVIAHLHGLSMDLTVGRTVDPTINPTVEITGQPVSRTQASDASGRLPRYEAKCVERTRFQWGSVPLRGNGATPANILIPLERQLTALQLCR